MTGRRRRVRRLLLPLGVVGDAAEMDAAARRLHVELLAELDAAGMVPEPQQGSVTLYTSVVELPRTADGVLQAGCLDGRDWSQPSRREPCPTGGREVPDWADAVELLLEAYVVPVAVCTDQHLPATGPSDLSEAARGSDGHGWECVACQWLETTPFEHTSFEQPGRPATAVVHGLSLCVRHASAAISVAPAPDRAPLKLLNAIEYIARLREQDPITMTPDALKRMAERPGDPL